MTANSKRRSFRFSLRALFFAVTVVGCWLGYQLNWIRQRHEFRAQQLSRFQSMTQDLAGELSPGQSTRAPRLLWLFGEDGVEFVDVFTATPFGSPLALTAEDIQDNRRAQQLFPEASIAMHHLSGGTENIYFLPPKHFNSFSRAVGSRP
jgi:hypothetical protein